MFQTEMRSHLCDHILPFWQKLKDDTNGGYIGFVGMDLVPNPTAFKGCILNSRILWTFSTAARVLNDPSYLPYAKHAFDFLKSFIDKENGGLYWSLTFDGKPLDTTKHTYCQAFAVYGLAAYARATGESEPLGMAMELLSLIESRCRDAIGYGEAYQLDFSPQSNEKLSENGVEASRTMNTLLHVIEAYAELYRAGQDERVAKLTAAALEQVLSTVYNPEKGRLDVFFDGAFRSLIDLESYGHDIEASWLLWDAVNAVIPQEARAPYRDMSLVLADSICKRALTESGVINECEAGKDDERRIWWVQAESVLGFLNAYELTGDDRYLGAVNSVWDSIKRLIIDKRCGEWYVHAEPDGTPANLPIVDEWKCPYHNSRMCLEVINRIHP
ncbi:MAG: N-acylglucosamine 2-epimerase [Clostridiales bacterium]|nr:N-acylglucosamine 2-epimerase [Clostridiales bacterium]